MPPTKTHVCENLGPQPETGANEVLTFLPAYGKKKQCFLHLHKQNLNICSFSKYIRSKLLKFNFVVLFLWCPLSCPSPFFVPDSFLPSSWLAPPSPIHLAFVLGRFGSSVVSFLPLLFFSAWLSLPSFFFSCWFWFGVLLSVVVPIFCFTWTFLLCFSFWGVWWTNSVEAWYFFGGSYWSY